jgi:hypothetical protein
MFRHGLLMQAKQEELAIPLQYASHAEQLAHHAKNRFLHFTKPKDKANSG